MLYNTDKSIFEGGLIIATKHIVNIKNLTFLICTFGLTFSLVLLYFAIANHLLFHTTAAFFIVIVGIISGTIGIISIDNENKNIYNRMASSLIVYSILLFVHTMTYEGLNIFSNNFSMNFSVQLLVYANLLLVLSFVVSFFDKNKVIHYKYFILNPIFVGIIIFGLAALTLLPPLYIENQGYTVLKIILEVLIITLLFGSIIHFFINKWIKNVEYDTFVFYILIILLVSQFFFLSTTIDYSLTNYFGIILRYAAFLIILGRTIILNIMKPYNKMFYSMQNEQAIQKQLLNELIEEQTRLNEIQKIGHIGTWILDLDTNLIWASDESFRIYGIAEHNDHFIDLKSIQKNVVAEDRAAMDKALTDLIRGEKPYDIMFSIVDDLGEFHYLNSVATLQYDEHNKPIKVNGVVHDITNLKSEQDKLLYASTHDYLTGVYNRRFYGNHLLTVDEHHNLPISVIICDINGLKIINDNFGHDEGNKVLVKVAQLLESNIDRERAFVARVGGDEFVILLKNTSENECSHLLENLIHITNSTQVNKIKLSVSFGFATKSDIEDDLNKKIQYAEDEMYRYKIADSSSVRNKMINALLNSLYEKDTISEEHSKRVSDLSASLAEAFKLSQQKISDIRLAGNLHDIGKITISNEILNKKTNLTKEEYDLIKTHPEKGYRILHSMGGLDLLANYVLQHHERIDGKGYPNGLSGDDISLEAKIITIADSFDAMTSYRDYKDSLTLPEAIIELRRCKGTQFDSDLTELFITQVLKERGCK